MKRQYVCSGTVGRGAKGPLAMDLSGPGGNHKLEYVGRA